ncbi:hypothetical protein [Billgrantia sp. C5P2]|uniref:hypothetical protein n=1 Tax=Billgrantia sp. C5P2 TaxID=3436239 RepID=UPI003DA41ACC
MGFIETLTVGVAAVALLALTHTMAKQRRPIRKEARIEEHERKPDRNRMRRD